MILTALLRTVVPALWGSLIAWLIGALPILAPMQEDLVGLANVILPIVTAVIIAAWYAFWRWLQPRLPDWLVRAVLGSAKTPVYVGKHAANSAGATVNITAPDISPEEAAAQASKIARGRLNL